MNEEFLKRMLIIGDAKKASPHEPSERAQRLFEEALASHQPFTDLTEEQMQVVILKIVSNGKTDYEQIAATINELRVRCEQGASILMFLDFKMMRKLLISPQPGGASGKLVFQIDEKGCALLQEKGEAVRTINERVATLWEKADSEKSKNQSES